MRSVRETVRAAILMVSAPLGVVWVQAAAADADATAPTAASSPATAHPSNGTAKQAKSAVAGGAGEGSGEALQEVTVTAQRLSLIGTAQTASEGVVVNDELTLTPAFRPGQVLETVPGLDVTVHSGEGKANQYLMRGYNLDHGTDLAVFIDDMPVNEPSHAHGQGYADINFMIPELATNVSYTKGTYYADEGDFASVGSVHINYLDSIPTQASETVGTMDFQRTFLAGSTAAGDGTVLGAFEFQHYDGPWTTPGDQRKVNGVLRFSSGDSAQGFTVTAMFYHDLWNAQTDQPERALTEGLIPSVYGILDPTDAGYAQRGSLSAVFHDTIGTGVLSTSAYAISNRLFLWNDFTHYLVDPVNGDQEQQHEDRETVGADSSYVWSSPLLGVDTDWMTGLHSRFDFNDVSRIPTQDRTALTTAQLAAVDYPPAFSESDVIHLGSVAGFFQVTSHWTDRLRSVLGFREDYMYGIDSGTNYGTADRALAQPKGSLIYRLDETTELYASAGRGFHSDDLRGVDEARIEGVAGAPLIASQTGEEVGVRKDLFDRRVSATLAVYNLVAQSETTYNPDIGQDSAGPGSHRTGYEVNVTYQATRWLELYGSYSGDRARYTSPYDDGTGHLGEYLPNAPFATGSFNVYVRDLGPWSGGLAYRYLGAYPLTSGPCSDEAVKTDFPGMSTCAQAPTPKGEVFGSGYGEWSAEVHYALGAGWSLGLAGYNLLNKSANAMEYFYIDRLPGEPADGVADVHFHPLEPISGRLTVAKRF
ncbi:MAG TPA: TonB-dependent receptor [Steroidobacteraceae bacterium]|nr:TonB-dependent receptor [Steroidobacteraceae bacterium]